MEGSLGLLVATMKTEHADVAAVAKKFAAEHVPDTRLNLRSLAPLLAERASLENRIVDRKHFISVTEPHIPAFRERVVTLKADLQAVQAAIADGASIGMGYLKAQEVAIQRKLTYAEAELAGEEKRLNVAKTILKGTSATLKTFDKQNGETIKKLKALDAAIDGDRPSTYRSSGDRHEAGLASTY